VKARGARIAVFSREYVPSGGLCPICSAVMDESGCRIISVNVIHDAPPAPPDPLRDLLLAHPFVRDVECTDPSHEVARREWEARQARP